MPRTTKPSRAQALARQVEASASGGTPAPKKTDVDPDRLVSSGSTLMNLALSGTPDGGYMLGKMVNLIGDSSSGKTFMALSMFAECAQDPRFDNYRFIHDDVENGCEFDVEYLFGSNVDDRIEPPRIDKEGYDAPSQTIQDWVANMERALKGDHPFIYVLDSFDALSSREADQRVAVEVKAQAAGKIPETGSYRMEKAKIGSEHGGRICRLLEDTDSLLIIISQTRDNIGVTFGAKKTRTGGRWLTFYNSHEIWLRVASKIKDPVHGRQLGVKMAGKIPKNRITGKVREFEAPIFYDYGMDDITSCVDFLIEEGVWKKAGSYINVELGGFSEKHFRKNIPDAVEDANLEDELRALVTKTWMDIEESIRFKRKRRYE